MDWGELREMIDMTNNRVPYGLLTDEEKAALHEHEKAGGEFKRYAPVDLGGWCYSIPEWCDESTYRTVPLPKTQDVIAWERLPAWVEWVARDADFDVLGHRLEPNIKNQDETWLSRGKLIRIDDFPGIVSLGTCDWKDSKQRRPRG
jgi:hypothetical protein